MAFANQFANFAREILGAAGLPAISIGIDSGDPTGGTDNNWTRNVLADGLKIGFVPGFISDHSYMQTPGNESDSQLLKNTVTNPSSTLDWSTRYAAYAALLQQTLSSQAADVSVIATEFNSVANNPGKQSTSLVNGLFIADSIGGLLDSGYSGAIVWELRDAYDSQASGNNSNLLYGWREVDNYGLLGEPSGSAPSAGTYIAYPSYYALQLASKVVAGGGQVVSAASNDAGLQVYAVKEANGHLDLLVVNANPVANLTDQFNVTGFQSGGSAQVWQYGEAQDTAQSQSGNGASALASFTASLGATGANFSFAFPAYSMTVLDLAPAPVLAGPSSVTVGGSNQVTFSGPDALSLSDPGAGDATIDTVALGVVQAALSVDTSGGATIIAGSNGTSQLTLSGTLMQLNAALSALVYSGPNVGGTDTLTAVATDGSSVSTSIAVTIELNVTFATNIALTASGSSITFGQILTLTSTVTSSAIAPNEGLVTFFNGNATLGTAPVSNGVATLSVTSLPAGSTALTAVYSDPLANFAGSDSAEVDVNVAQAMPSLIVTASGGTYSGVGFAAAASVDGAASLEGVSPTYAYFAGSTVNGSGSSAAPIHAGTYTVVASFAGSADYMAAESFPATFLIAPAPLLVVANDQTKSYRAPPPPLSASYVGFVGDDSAASLAVQPTLTTTATSGSHVAGGPYPITASGAVDPDYTIGYVAGALTVTPAPLTIMADNQTNVYGAALPSLTASYSGFVNGDSASSLTALPTLATTATAGSHVAGSPYPITASGAVDADYTIGYTPGASRSARRR